MASRLRDGTLVLQQFSGEQECCRSCSSHCDVSWAAPGSAFMLVHCVPGPFSLFPQEKERACTSWHLLFIDSTWGTPWSYICTYRGLSFSQNTPSLVEVADKERANRLLTLKADQYIDNPQQTVEIIAIGFSGSRIQPLNEVSYKAMDLTSEAIPDVLVICSQRSPGLLSQPARYQIQQLILEFSLGFLLTGKIHGLE